MRKPKLPKEIFVLGFTVYIREASLEGPLGQWDPKTNTITIEKDQPYIGKQVILVHELMHAVDDMLITNKFRKRHVDHKFIEGAALGLFYALVACGLWKGLTLEEVNKTLFSSAFRRREKKTGVPAFARPTKTRKKSGA